MRRSKLIESQPIDECRSLHYVLFAQFPTVQDRSNNLVEVPRFETNVAFIQRPRVEKRKSDEEKKHLLHLHITEDVVELFGPTEGTHSRTASRGPSGDNSMKKIMILMVVTLAASSIGCNRSWPRRWCFRGDACKSCATYETTTNYSGYPGGTVLGSNLMELPGPAVTDE